LKKCRPRPRKKENKVVKGVKPAFGQPAGLENMFYTIHLEIKSPEFIFLIKPSYKRYKVSGTH
jgi:hypothetical protein